MLNKGWAPINVITVKHAMTLVVQDAAKFVDESYATFDFDSWREAKQYAQEASAYLHGCDWRVMVPEVIILANYTGINKRQVKFSRRNIFERDRHTCQYCGKHLRTADLTLDHVVPRSRGGKSQWTNVVLACYDCNKRKDAKTPAEARMKLLKKPEQPRWEQVKVRGVRGQVPSSWEKFLSEMYWEAELKT